MTNAFDIAREMARLSDRWVDSHGILKISRDEAHAEVVRAFPSATWAEIERAFDIFRDRVRMALEEIEEHLDAINAAIRRFMINGAPLPTIEAMIQELEANKPKPFNVEKFFPKPDKTKS